MVLKCGYTVSQTKGLLWYLEMEPEGMLTKLLCGGGGGGAAAAAAAVCIGDGVVGCRREWCRAKPVYRCEYRGEASPQRSCRNLMRGSWGTSFSPTVQVHGNRWNYRGSLQRIVKPTNLPFERDLGPGDLQWHGENHTFGLHRGPELIDGQFCECSFSHAEEYCRV